MNKWTIILLHGQLVTLTAEGRGDKNLFLINRPLKVCIIGALEPKVADDLLLDIELSISREAGTSLALVSPTAHLVKCTMKFRSASIHHHFIGLG